MNINDEIELELAVNIYKNITTTTTTTMLIRAVNKPTNKLVDCIRSSGANLITQYLPSPCNRVIVLFAE